MNSVSSSRLFLFPPSPFILCFPTLLLCDRRARGESLRFPAFWSRVARLQEESQRGFERTQLIQLRIGFAVDERSFEEKRTCRSHSFPFSSSLARTNESELLFPFRIGCFLSRRLFPMLSSSVLSMRSPIACPAKGSLTRAGVVAAARRHRSLAVAVAAAAVSPSSNSSPSAAAPLSSPLKRSRGANPRSLVVSASVASTGEKKSVRKRIRENAFDQLGG